MYDTLDWITRPRYKGGVDPKSWPTIDPIGVTQAKEYDPSRLLDLQKYNAPLSSNIEDRRNESITQILRDRALDEGKTPDQLDWEKMQQADLMRRTRLTKGNFPGASDEEEADMVPEGAAPTASPVPALLAEIERRSRGQPKTDEQMLEDVHRAMDAWD